MFTPFISNLIHFESQSTANCNPFLIRIKQIFDRHFFGWNFGNFFFRYIFYVVKHLDRQTKNSTYEFEFVITFFFFVLFKYLLLIKIILMEIQITTICILENKQTNKQYALTNKLFCTFKERKSSSCLRGISGAGVYVCEMCVLVFLRNFLFAGWYTFLPSRIDA